MVHRVRLQRKLNTFDVTNLVVGAIIGADIYVATGISAGLIGPSSLLAWILAGLMAVTISISFAYCVFLLPKVGGPYAYARQVSTPFVGFTVGWALLLAEWFSLAVFPVAFVQYFMALVPGIDELTKILLKAVFIVIIVSTNVIGVKAAGRVNDILTLAKLSPLVLIVIGGLFFMVSSPTTVASNLTPFFTGDAFAFGQALILIFWAYAGFELSTIPADEVERPERTIPRAMAIGMTIVVAFYLLTNLVVFSSVDEKTLSASTSPLIAAASHIFADFSWLTPMIVAIVGVGALVSIMGADESGTIGTSRLAYAMSLDGLMPKVFSRTHSRFGTPYVGLLILCLTAFVASLVGGLAALINASVFLLAFVYLATCVSTLLLVRRDPNAAKGLRGRRVVPILGIGLSLSLMALVNPSQILLSLVLLAVGVPVYRYLAPKKELAEEKAAYLSRESVLHRTYHQSKRFLAFPVREMKHLIYRIRKVERAWVSEEDEVLHKDEVNRR